MLRVLSMALLSDLAECVSDANRPIFQETTRRPMPRLLQETLRLGCAKREGNAPVERLALDRDEAHRGPSDRLTDRLGVAHCPCWTSRTAAAPPGLAVSPAPTRSSRLPQETHDPAASVSSNPCRRYNLTILHRQVASLLYSAVYSAILMPATAD
jgi:hypothetical protein